MPVRKKLDEWYLTDSHARLTSSLANLCNGLLNRYPSCPSDNLLALELILLLSESVDAVTKEVEETLENGNTSTKTHNNGHSSSCEESDPIPSIIKVQRTRQTKNTTHSEATKSSGPRIVLFPQVHSRPREENVGGRGSS